MPNPNETDVATILEQLRTELRALRTHQGEQDGGSALRSIQRELQSCAEQLEITRVVSAHWPLEGRTLYERGWAVINRIVRRGLRWYINPIVEQQNAFNATAARTMQLLIEAYAELNDQLSEQTEQSSGRGPLPAAGSDLPSDTPTSDLQQLVQEEGLREPPAAMPDLTLRPWPAKLREHESVDAHWSIEGTTPLTQARAIAQRGLRQYLRWLINPIVEQQNGANGAISATIPHLIAADAELRAKLANVRAHQ
jgi:hypothetical protein